MNRDISASFMPCPSRETGAALFVSLVFLFVLTVIGLTGMQNTYLQEKMAGHMRERSIAFQSAESALRVGEEYLAGNIPTFVCTSATDGLYVNSTPGTTTDCPASAGSPSSDQLSAPYPPENEAFWKNNTDVVSVKGFSLPGETGHTFDNLADKPKYVLEILSSGAPGAAVSLEAGTPVPPSPKYYRITAHGTGMSDSAVSVTQSVVRQLQ